MFCRCRVCVAWVACVACVAGVASVAWVACAAGVAWVACGAWVACVAAVTVPSGVAGMSHKCVGRGYRAWLGNGNHFIRLARVVRQLPGVSNAIKYP